MSEPGCPYVAACDADYTRAQERVDQLWSTLSDEQLRWKPGPERWSVAECVGHLSKTMVEHVDKLEAAIKKGRAKGKLGGEAPYGRGTWIGRVFLGFLDPDRTKPKKLKAPGQFHGGSADVDPAAVRAEFQALNGRLLALLHEAEGLDFGRVKVAPPPTNLVKLSLAQGFQLHRWHHHRHLDQADRVTQETGFPSA
ncbi:MAG: DinB family protein [Planctomycetota bacterium]|nr:DinB family protein [Planctomycetota bacterium]